MLVFMVELKYNYLVLGSSFSVPEGYRVWTVVMTIKNPVVQSNFFESETFINVFGKGSFFMG